MEKSKNYRTISERLDKIEKNLRLIVKVIEAQQMILKHDLSKGKNGIFFFKRGGEKK